MLPEPVVIAVVRPDLLGTYGDAGNATVLARRLEWRGLAAKILEVERDDPVPTTADLCLLGGGEDRARRTLMDDSRVVRGITAAHRAGAVLLGVCAGLQVLGQRFVDEDGTVHDGIGLLDCATDRRLDRRAVGEAVVDPLLPHVQRVTGFENHRGATRLGPDGRPLGRVVIGVGNGDGHGSEGALGDRIVGTYLHGPVLALNPDLADRLLEWIVGPLPPLELPEIERLREERMRRARPRARWRR